MEPLSHKPVDRIAELEDALSAALDGWQDAAAYKSDFLREKHGDVEMIAKLRLVLEPLSGPIDA